MSSSKLLTATLLVAAAISTGLATAQTRAGGTQSGAFNVSVQVLGGCEALGVSDLVFDASAPTAGTRDTNGNITVSCTTGLDYTVGLNAGQNDAGGRHMADTGSSGVRIPYSLSSSAAGGASWDDSTNVVSGTDNGLGESFRINHPIYARATLSGNEPAGSYQDTITATLTF